MQKRIWYHDKAFLVCLECSEASRKLHMAVDQKRKNMDDAGDVSAGRPPTKIQPGRLLQSIK